LVNTPVEQVLDEVYAPLVGRTPIRAPGINKDTPITLRTVKEHNLTRSEAIMALETILGLNNITVVNIGDKFFKVVGGESASTAGGLSVTNSAASLPDAGKFITEIVQLKYADPDQVVKALTYFTKTGNIIYIPSTESLILRDYTENVKRMLEMVEQLDVESPLTIKSEVIPIRYALAEDISSALGQLGAGSGSVGKSTSGTQLKATSTGGTVGTSGGANTGSTFPGQANSTGLSSGASGARSTLGSRLNNIVSGASGGSGGGPFNLFGQTKIIADERTNSLLVFANDEDMKMIKKIIKELDVVLAQVLIEAVYLDVTLDNNKSFGISLSQNPSTRGSLTGAGGYVTSGANSFPGSSSTTSSSGTNGSSGNIVGMGNSILNTLPQGLSYFGSYGQDFNAILEAAASDSRVTVLSRPQIQTSHAVEAELFIGSTIPYVTGTQNYGYSSGPSASYTQMEVGIRLRILPLINPDGLVVMDIDQEIEQINGSQEIAGVGAVPTTSKDDAGAKVAVMSGQTIILGGYINARRESDHDGVPWLMDIPVLGNLFKSSANKNSREELILLIRPTVLKTPEIAAQVATEERATMGGITQAEREIRKDEDARNAQANKELAADAAKQAKKDKKAGIQHTNSPAQFNPNDVDTSVEFHVFGTNDAIDFHLSPSNHPTEIHPGDTNLSIRPSLNDTNTSSIIVNKKP